jgi:hypothetical protein
MRGIDRFIGSLAAAGMMLASSMAVGATSTVQGGGGLPGAGSETCLVRVKRNAAAGVFDLSRQILNNGRCVCRVSTGPRSQGGSAESALAGLLLRRSCSDAPLAEAGAAGGGLGTGAIIGGVVVVGGGLGAALASGGSKSP